MTDSEKLDLVLEKVIGLDQRVSGLEQRMSNIEKDIVDVKSDLKNVQRHANFILDEVERVHIILDTHMKDTDKHTA